MKNLFSHIDLPVVGILPEMETMLANQSRLLIGAPAGAGKSTIVPLALLGAPWLLGQKIIVLEPRRLAARAIASRMASLLGERVGETVGYRIRFENQVSNKTRIEVVTEGILTRMLLADNTLDGVGAVVFDEFHERSVFADEALVLCTELQQVLRPDLRLIIMSATLDMAQLSEKLDAQRLECSGRLFPVDIRYAGAANLPELSQQTARLIVKVLREQSGDVLVFLPGEAEIKQCEKLLAAEANSFMVHALYGQLPFDSQQAALLPDTEGRRKVILATSIAETSLTIEGVSVVVDCGYSRLSRYDARTGLSKLETVPVSKNSATQRAGRAGRLGPGVCYRMWTAATHEHLAENHNPEIVEADLATLVLDLAIWGVNDIYQLNWLTPPPKRAALQAIQLLEQLGAISEMRVSQHGKAIHRLACHPRIAHMLLKAADAKLLPLATDLAALLEERDPLQNAGTIDINLRIEMLRQQRSEKRLSKEMNRVERVAATYRSMMRCHANDVVFDHFDTGRLLLWAYPERVAMAKPGANAVFQLSNGSLAKVDDADDMAHLPWLAAAHVQAREGMGKIFLASAVNPDHVRLLASTREVVKWESRKGGIVAVEETRFGAIVFQQKPLAKPDEELVNQAIIEAVKAEGEQLLAFDGHFEQWQNRLLSLRIWNENEDWPDVSIAALLNTCETWLLPWLQGVRKTDDLKKINLVQALQFQLSAHQQEMLAKLAPEKILVPSGSFIKLQYHANGAQPVLAVRLQELFGMTDTPVVNHGKIAVLVHLLSPGYKPVQVTADLRSFWQNTYFEVKKELKRRYPKHAWPDDPMAEKAIRGVKRK